MKTMLVLMGTVLLAGCQTASVRTSAEPGQAACGVMEEALKRSYLTALEWYGRYSRMDGNVSEQEKDAAGCEMAAKDMPRLRQDIELIHANWPICRAWARNNQFKGKVEKTQGEIDRITGMVAAVDTNCWSNPDYPTQWELPNQPGKREGT